MSSASGRSRAAASRRDAGVRPLMTMSGASSPVGDAFVFEMTLDDGDVAGQREPLVLDGDRAVAVDDQPQVGTIRCAKSLGFPRHVRRRCAALAGKRDQPCGRERSVAAGEMNLIERDARRHEMRAQAAVGRADAVLRRVDAQRFAGHGPDHDGLPTVPLAATSRCARPPSAALVPNHGWNTASDARSARSASRNGAAGSMRPGSTRRSRRSRRSRSPCRRAPMRTSPSRRARRCRTCPATASAVMPSPRALSVGHDVRQDVAALRGGSRTCRSIAVRRRSTIRRRRPASFRAAAHTRRASRCWPRRSRKTRRAS